MAVKITIDFLDNPTIGDAFSYTLSVAAGNILYNNGQNVLDLNYISGANTPLFDMQRKSTKPETINNTLQFLQDNWQHPNITYARVNDTIEVTINIADVVVTYGSALNDEITIDDELIADITEKLIYFADYTDPENNDYFIKIYKKGFAGDATKISGYGVLKYGSAKDLLDPIRGNGLDLNLEADLSLTLEDLYTEEENQFTVRFYRGNKLLFDGFLKPDGIYQSFVSDRWMLNLTCVDGLGILKDLAFVQSNGFAFTGRMNAVDVIFNCLRRTNLNLPINTSVNIYYEGLVPSDLLDPLTQVYLSVDRFKKGDYDTLMDCQEVLTSVLNLFNANICQVDGEWYIYKANEILAQPLVKFRRYLKNTNSFDKVVTKNLAFTLGSHVNGRYPHHAGGNQQIEIKGSLSSVRTNYKYGFVKSLNSNPNLNHTNKDYPGWDVINPGYVIVDPAKNSGLLSEPVPQSFATVIYPIVRSVGVDLLENDIFKFVVSARRTNLAASIDIAVRFRVIIVNTFGTTTHYMTSTGTWQISTAYNIDLSMGATLNVAIQSAPMPADGKVKIEIWQAIKSSSVIDDLYEVTKADIENSSTGTATNGASGEFHTVQRQNRPSSIAKDTIEIFNGDSPSLIYEGTIYKADQITPTSKWFRNGITESKPILQIAGEDNLRISQKSAKIFTGDAYGFVPYLSVITIDSLTGVFMPIEWSFNTKTNMVSMKLLEGFTDELNDIKYTYNFEYGNTVKPTITS